MKFKFLFLLVFSINSICTMDQKDSGLKISKFPVYFDYIDDSCCFGGRDESVIYLEDIPIKITVKELKAKIKPHFFKTYESRKIKLSKDLLVFHNFKDDDVLDMSKYDKIYFYIQQK